MIDVQPILAIAESLFWYLLLLGIFVFSLHHLVDEGAMHWGGAALVSVVFVITFAVDLYNQYGLLAAVIYVSIPIFALLKG